MEWDEQTRWQAEVKAMEDDFQAKRSAFLLWRDKKLKGLKMPPYYEIILEDIAPLCEYALHKLAGREGYYDTLCFMYDLGFKRGMNCQRAKERKKKKAAACAANTDNDRSGHGMLTPESRLHDNRK